MKYLKKLLTLSLSMRYEFDPPDDPKAVKVTVYSQIRARIRKPVDKATIEEKMTMSKRNYVRSPISCVKNIIHVNRKFTTDVYGEALILEIPKDVDWKIKLTATAADYESTTISFDLNKGRYSSWLPFTLNE